MLVGTRLHVLHQVRGHALLDPDLSLFGRHRPEVYAADIFARMEGAELMRITNRSLIGFDLMLGSAALIAPAGTLRALGHERPNTDAEHLFRRCGPIWLTFAAAHALAAIRGEPRDWWALAWLRGTEIATDIVWSASPAIRRPGAKLGLRLAGAFNLAAAVGFAGLAQRERA
ncbi:MAG: hypothetical protein NVSMB51_04860 [Solirubrobacteraceae bacterium]